MVGEGPGELERSHEWRWWCLLSVEPAVLGSPAEGDIEGRGEVEERGRGKREQWCSQPMPVLSQRMCSQLQSANTWCDVSTHCQKANYSVGGNGGPDQQMVESNVVSEHMESADLPDML